MSPPELRVSHVRCPYCHMGVRPNDAKLACVECMAWHHRECWEDHGRCAACARGGKDEPRRALQVELEKASPEPEPAAPGDDPWTGRVLGGFRLTRRLRRGCSGSLYYAGAPAEGAGSEQVIVTLRPADARSTRDPRLVLADWEREAETFARVCHPNLAGTRAAGLSREEVPYVVRDACFGDGLESRVGCGSRRAAQLVLGLARGLATIHAAGLVHGQVAPENVGLDAQGPRLICYGSTWAGFMDLPEYRRFASGPRFSRYLPIAKHKPSYLAPEVVAVMRSGQRALDGRLDIYSLGLVFYLLLTGNEPMRFSLLDYPSGEAFERIPPPEDYAPDLPDRTRRVLGTMLAPEPHHRYRDVPRLMDDLRILAEEPELRAGIPRLWGPRKWPSRRTRAPRRTWRS